jgi:hypothetical protein
MSTRFPACVALFVVLLGLSIRPASAQPVPPSRPRSNPFQNLFFPKGQAVPNAGLGMGGNLAAPAGNANQLGVIGQPVLLKGPDGKSTPYLMLPLQTQPAVFANYGHWYSRTGNLGHWYPGGFKGGLGVLAGSVGGGLGGFSGPQVGTGMGMGTGISTGFGGGFRTGNLGPAGFGPQPTPAFGLRIGGR